MTGGARPVPDGPHEQMDDAAFYVLGGDYSLTEPVDGRAVYGHPVLGDRDASAIGAPVRKSARDLKTAIRSAEPGDRVRVNDGPWLEVTERDDEGFLAVPENGSVERAVHPDNPRNRPPGTFDLAWMRRADDWTSMGEVACLEVDWGPAPRR